MQVLELYSGTATFSKVARQLGHRATTVDNDADCEPDLWLDLSMRESADIIIEQLRDRVDCLWASPPCECFSVAAIGHHWDKTGKVHTPKTSRAEAALQMLGVLVYLITELRPKTWYIENPVGKMRMVAPYDHIPDYFTLHTVTYCQYGDDPGESGLPRMKPTDVWTNNHLWVPRQRCSPGAPCHEPAARGSKTGTQGRRTYLERSRLPLELCVEVLKASEEAMA